MNADNRRVVVADERVTHQQPSDVAEKANPPVDTGLNLQLQLGRYEELVQRLRALIRGMFGAPSTPHTHGDSGDTLLQKGLQEAELFHLLLYDLGLIHIALLLIREKGGVATDASDEVSSTAFLELIHLVSERLKTRGS